MKTNLEYYRKKAGLTITELADKTGISITTISRVEKGAYDLTGSKWLLIADAFGLTVDELIRYNYGRGD